MKIVLDASAAIRIARRDKGHEPFKKALEEAEWVQSPDLFVPEVTTVCWKYHKLGHLSLDNSEITLEETISMVDEFVASASLYREAFSMAIKGPKAAYDMFYLTLARRSNSTWVSADDKLIAFAEKHDVKVLRA